MNFHPALAVIGVLFGVLLGVYSNYFFESLRSRLFPNNPTIKHLINLGLTFITLVLIVAASNTGSSALWTLTLLATIILVVSVIVSTYGRPITAWIKRQSRLRRVSFLIVLTVTSLISLYFISSLVIALFEQRTLYVVLDASENMGDLLKEASARVEAEAITAPEQVEVGMAVFGGYVSNTPGCDDYKEFVRPLPKQDSLDKISRATRILSALTPRNVGSIQTAAKQSLMNLVGRRGVQQIFIVASSIDKRCGPLDKSALVTFAKQNGVEYELYIATLGSLSEEDRNVLNDYTDGKHIPLASIEELSNAVEEVINTPPSIYRLYYYLSDR